MFRKLINRVYLVSGLPRANSIDYPYNTYALIKYSYKRIEGCKADATSSDERMRGNVAGILFFPCWALKISSKLSRYTSTHQVFTLPLEDRRETKWRTCDRLAKFKNSPFLFASHRIAITTIANKKKPTVASSAEWVVITDKYNIRMYYQLFLRSLRRTTRKTTRTYMPTRGAICSMRHAFWRRRSAVQCSAGHWHRNSLPSQPTTGVPVRLRRWKKRIRDKFPEPSSTLGPSLV